MTNPLRLPCRASAASRGTCTSGSARRTSALLAQRAVETVEQIVRAAHAVGCAVVVVEVDALLDEAESRAGALGTELERRERDADRSVTDVHRIAPHDALVWDDVVIHRVVAMLGPTRRTATPHFAPTDPEVDRVLGHLPSIDASEPARLLRLIGERVEHACRGDGIPPFDREAVVLRPARSH